MSLQRQANKLIPELVPGPERKSRWRSLRRGGDHELPPASRVAALAAAGAGILHLRLPSPRAAAKMRAWLENERQPCTCRAECLSIAVRASEPAGFYAALGRQLTGPERGATRAVFQPIGRELTLEDYFDMQSLNGFLARQENAWLFGLLAGDGLAIHFQPIVTATPAPTLYAYECLMRGTTEAGLISPARILHAARETSLADRLDAAARHAALRATARHGVQVKAFVNFSAAAVYDPEICLYDILALTEELHLNPRQVVFEAVESEDEEDLGHLASLLTRFRHAGFEVALDDLSAGYSSLHRLETLRPDYIKLDIELISGVDRDPYKALIASKLLDTAQTLGVKTVAEGVETEAEFEWARAHGADFVQGFYVAQPGLPPPLPAVLRAKAISVPC